MFFLVLDNSIFLKKIFMNVKNIFTEINLIFDIDGLKIYEYNSKNTLCLQIFINKHFFDKYEFNKKISINLNLIEFYKCLKPLRENSALIFEIIDNIQSPQIKVQIKKNYKITNFNMNIKINNKTLIENGLLNILLKQKFIVDNKNIIKNLTSMQYISSEVNIKIKDNLLILEGKDDFNSQITQIQINSIPTSSKELDLNLNNYILKEIMTILNCSLIFKYNELHVEKNKPLLFNNYSENIYFKIYLLPNQNSHY